MRREWRLRLRGDDVTLFERTPWHQVTAADIDRWLEHPESRRRALEMYFAVVDPAVEKGMPGLAGRVHRALGNAFQRGGLRALRRTSLVPPVAAPVSADAEPGRRKAGTAPATTFVAIALLDEQGNPMAGERYRITLPSGSDQEGTLDANGRVRITDIDPGTCKVTFPGLGERGAT